MITMQLTFLRVIVLSALWAAAVTSSGAEELSGRVTNVIDGDDIELCTSSSCTRIRLCGIDAPERGCPGYDEARAALSALVEGKQVRCIQVGAGTNTVCDGNSKPTNGTRIVAQCFVDEADVAGNLVEQGLACDWVRYSGGHYSRNGKGRACPPNHRRTCAAVLPRGRP